MPEGGITVAAEKAGSKTTAKRLRDKVLFGEHGIPKTCDASAAVPRDANAQPPVLSSADGEGGPLGRIVRFLPFDFPNDCYSTEIFIGNIEEIGGLHTLKNLTHIVRRLIKQAGSVRLGIVAVY
jgi:hypothetical protein